MTLFYLELSVLDLVVCHLNIILARPHSTFWMRLGSLHQQRPKSLPRATLRQSFTPDSGYFVTADTRDSLE